jgi:hypothetical protein
MLNFHFGISREKCGNVIIFENSCKMPPLPLEIVIYIIDHLFDCPAVLNNCSHVCRAWLAISRYHLFYHIRFSLSGPAVSNRFQRLHNTIEQSPSVALYIRELSIVRSFQMEQMPGSEWPKLGVVVPLLFGKLSSLQKFDVRGINWSRLTPDVRSSVRALLALPSLVHLAVRYITVSRLEHFAAILPPNLKRLSVSQIHIRTDDVGVTHAIDMENDQMSTRNPRRLEYLRVYNSPMVNNWLLGGQSDVDVSNIHTLDICNESEGMSKLVRRVGSSLENLKISYLFGGS